MKRRPLRFGELLVACLLGIGTFLGVAAGGLDLDERVDVIAVAQLVVSGLAVALFLVLERPTWRDLQEDALWIDSIPVVRKRLRALFVAKALLLVAIAAVGFSTTPCVLTVLAFMLATGLLLVVHWVVVSHLGTACQLRAPVDRKGGPFKWLPPLPDMRGGLVIFVPRFVEIVPKLLRRAWAIRLPITVSAVLLVLAPLTCVSSLAIRLIGHGHHAKPTSDDPGAGSPEGDGDGSSSTTATTTQTTSTATTETTTSTPAPFTSEPSWSGTCPGQPPTQTEAKEPAIASIERAYSPTVSPSRLEKGCMGHIYPKQFRHEFYAEMVGDQPETQTPLSLCVDSEAFGAAVFLWAIAPEIEELIAEVGPVGGPPVAEGHFPHYGVGTSGEMYLVDSRRGIYIYVRHTSGEQWVKLVPTLARAFLGAMNGNKHHWLWPSQPLSRSNGDKTVKLRYVPEGPVVTEITLKHSGVALGNHVEYMPRSVREAKIQKPKVEALNVKELEELALTAQ